MPGQLRRGPVWVGSPTDSPDTAVFVPPAPELLGDLLHDWERFVNEPARMPVLIRYERLQAVRERGEIQQWLQFFLTAVQRQAADGVDRAGTLVRLREKYLTESARTRSRIGEVVGLLFANPFVTVRRVESALGMTNQGARNLIRDAQARGWLDVVDVSGRGGRTYWVARDVLDVIEAPPAYRPRAGRSAP